MGRATIWASRALVFLTGAALLVGGVYGIALWAGLPLANSLALRMDRLWYFTAPEQQWWPWALGGAAALCLIAGLALVIAVLRPRPHRMAVLARRSLGVLAVDPGTVASAVASSIEGIDGVLKAQSSSRKIAGTPTISITVTISPHTAVAPLRSLLESTTRQAMASFGPGSPSFRYFVRVEPL